MADLTKLTAELAGMKQKMVDRLVAQGDETIQPDDTMQTIVDHFDNLRIKVANQDKEITANGEYTADEGYTGLGTVTVDVKPEPVPKYGATIDNILGDVDENGVLQSPAETFDLVFDGVKSLSDYLLAYKFYKSASVRDVVFPDLEQVNGYFVLGSMLAQSSAKSFKADKLKAVNGEAAFQQAYNACNSIVSMSFAELETISGDRVFERCAYNSTSLQSFNFNKLKVTNSQSLFSYAFYQTKKLTVAAFPSLEEIIKGNGVFQYAFTYSAELHTAFFPRLRKVTGDGVFANMFQRAYKLTKVNFDALESISGVTVTSYWFDGCNKLQKISFPSLTTLSNAGILPNTTFSSCTLLTEIHFRADAQSVIEAQINYSKKFGASYATIYFDLIGTITVNGVAYVRNEPNSIYVEYDKTYIAWADEDGNIVYTTAGTEPTIGTAVYSDESVTQVGTVEAVA